MAERLIDAGQSLAQVSQALGISQTTIWRWSNNWAKAGPSSLIPGKWRSGRRPKTQESAGIPVERPEPKVAHLTKAVPIGPASANVSKRPGLSRAGSRRLAP